MVPGLSARDGWSDDHVEHPWSIETKYVEEERKGVCVWGGGGGRKETKAGGPGRSRLFTLDNIFFFFVRYYSADLRLMTAGHAATLGPDTLVRVDAIIFAIDPRQVHSRNSCWLSLRTHRGPFVS